MLGTTLVGRAGSTKGLGRWVVAAWEVLPVGLGPTCEMVELQKVQIAKTLGLRSNTTSDSDARKALKTEQPEYSQKLDRFPT